MKKSILIVLVSVVLSGLLAFYLCNKGETKLGWVSINKVYNDFELKKELEAKLLKTQEVRKSIVDSAEFELQVLARQIKADGQKDKDKIAVFEMKREKYLNDKQEMEQDNQAMQQQYNEQILTQINQYLKDYGKEEGYTYIFGAEGSGGLMYAEETKEITTDVVMYINARYKGKTK